MDFFIAVFSLAVGSILIPSIFQYMQARNLLNHLLMELISNRIVLLRYKKAGIKILDEHAWEKTKENEFLVKLLLETSHPNVLHKITNAYHSSRSRSIRDQLTDEDLDKCLERFSMAHKALWMHLRKISAFSVFHCFPEIEC